MVDAATGDALPSSELLVGLPDVGSAEERDPAVGGDVRRVIEEDGPEVVNAQIHGAVLLVRGLVEGIRGRDKRGDRVCRAVSRAGPVRHQAVLVAS